MARQNPANAIVGLSQFGPQVLNAGYFQFEKAMEFRYELKLHHLILVEQGQLDAGTPSGRICAKAGDFLCFRPSLDMVYRVTPETKFYQAAVQFLRSTRSATAARSALSGRTAVWTGNTGRPKAARTSGVLTFLLHESSLTSSFHDCTQASLNLLL